jgi:hypothetical protein
MNRGMGIVVLLIVLMTLSFSNKELFPQEQSVNVISEKMFILIIDFAFFNCPLCVQSLTDFNNIINAFKLEDSLIGVMVYRETNNEVDAERRIKIIETQLRGFIQGNDIRYPIILDKKGIFKSLSQDEASLILLDIEKKTVRKYTFPLKKGQIDELFLKDTREKNKKYPIRKESQ